MPKAPKLQLVYFPYLALDGVNELVDGHGKSV